MLSLEMQSPCRSRRFFARGREASTHAGDVRSKTRMTAASDSSLKCQLVFLFVFAQSADGELLLWSVGEEGAGLVDGREGRDVQWATQTATGVAASCIFLCVM
jgi:hypothetical protein